MRFRALLILALAVLPAWAPAAFAAVSSRPSVEIVEVPGILDGPYVNYIRETIRKANTRNTALIVLELDSPGALRIQVEGLLGDIQNSKAPVAVWVGPRSARASAAAALLVHAAGVAGMSPGATVGPIHPMDFSEVATGANGRLLEQQERELLNRFLPGPRASTAGVRGDSPFLLRELNSEEALSTRAVRFVTPSLAQFLEKLDGQTVAVGFNTTTLSLKSKDVDVRFNKPGPIRRFLHAMTSASLVYLLLIVGVALIVFELYQPGFGVAGVTGGLMIAAAGYGLWVLPVSWWGATLFFAGLGLMTLDVAMHGLGVPTAAGTLALVAGSIELISVGVLRVPVWLVAVSTVAALVYFVPVMTVVRRNQRPIGRGATRALLGEHGEVRSVLNPEGFVWISGALWRARSEDGAKLRVGEPVRVTGLEGELLMVQRSV